VKTRTGQGGFVEQLAVKLVQNILKTPLKKEAQTAAWKALDTCRGAEGRKWTRRRRINSDSRSWPRPLCSPPAAINQDEAAAGCQRDKTEGGVQVHWPQAPYRRGGFENKSAYGQGRLGTAASDILVTELVKSGKFIVVERDRLNKVMEEQKFQSQGMTDPATVAKLGQVMGLEGHSGGLRLAVRR
jgi:hypothetical protein